MRARENPFRSERLERLAFRHALPLEAIHARWTALGRRAAVVGPHGSGKTTLLRALAASAEREGFRVERWFLNAESGRPSTRELTRAARRLGPRDVLCFDGAGHLGPLAWHRVRRAARAAGGVLATAHAPGLLPTLVETGTDAALLDELACELLAADTGPLRPLLAELHARHRGNLRDVFLALYDLAASADPRMVMPGHAPPPPARATEIPLEWASPCTTPSDSSSSPWPLSPSPFPRSPATASSPRRARAAPRSAT